MYHYFTDIVKQFLLDKYICYLVYVHVLYMCIVCMHDHIATACHSAQLWAPPTVFLQLADAKKRLDEDQGEMEALQNAKRKQDKELEAIREQLETAQADAQKALRSKKKLQEEVCVLYYNVVAALLNNAPWLD